MHLAPVALGKSAFPEKAGARTPTALLETKSMRQSTLTEHSSDAVVCPGCGKTGQSHHAYANHYTKKQDSDHEGDPTVARFGRERLVDLYWEYTYEEIADILGVGSTTVFNAYDELNLPKKTEYNRVAWEHGVSKGRIAYHLHYDAKMTTTEMADVLDVSRSVVDSLFEKSDVCARSQGEASALAFDEMSEEERMEITEAGRERQQEKYGDGRAIGHWVQENPERHVKIARKSAPKGTPAREENGMAGATGQDNPNWRGGKSVYDAVKKQLSDKSWRQKRVEAKERDGNACQMCGSAGCRLDSHHIVPIMAGGTNGFWNLMTLCGSCHGTAEAFIRQYPEFDPVLIE